LIREALKIILAGKNLSIDEASQVMDTIMNGEATPAQIAGFIVALKLKGEKTAEVAGMVQSMRAHSVKIKLNDQKAVDGVGTGGDGAHTFNVSTASAIVAAAAGITVAKHGNRSVSSKCGSADLLEKTGGNIDPGPDKVAENINRNKFGFMFAPRFHPAMKYAATPRKELGVRTVFNILGPMTNPAGVKRQLTGVFSKDLIPLMAEVLSLTGSEHIIVAHSQDGLDEFSISAPTDYIEVKNGKTESHILYPNELGIKEYPGNALLGGDPQYNYTILEDVLEGIKSPYRDATLLNAAGLIYLGEKSESIAEGMSVAAEAVDSGAAKETLATWVKDSNS
jgi:anthranilate phosphoribosyltransferase